MRVSSGDYFSKTNGPRSGATKYGILNESKQMAYLNIFFEKSMIKYKPNYFKIMPMLRVQANACMVHVLKYFSLMSLIDLDLHGFHLSV